MRAANLVGVGVGAVLLLASALTVRGQVHSAGERLKRRPEKLPSLTTCHFLTRSP